MKYQIDDNFIHQLFANPTFQLKLSKSQTQNSSHLQKRLPSSQMNNIVDEICTILSQQFKSKINNQCLSIYQSHLQMMKQVEQIKSNMNLISPTKTSINEAKNMSNSILSEMLVDQSIENSRVRRDNEQIVSKIGNNSFMSSFIFESEAKQMKQELQERINATIINLSGDVAKFQSSVQQRLKNVQHAMNRKMQSIYKTLTSIFETINDLQTKLADKKQPKDYNPKDHIRKELMEKIQTKIVNKSTKQKNVEIPVLKEIEPAPKRRSFLGFIKY